jgi:peroxiredoxin Q/BCP
MKKATKKTTKKPAKKVTAVGKTPSLVGKSIISLELPSTAGGTLSFKSLKGKKFVVYFYPKDLTPGCTIEAEDFSRVYNQFKKLGVEVLGISRDNLKLHARFCEKHNITFPLLSDEDEIACKQFDVIKMKNMYGKKVRGIERSTFVIDENGKIAHEWRKVKVQGHVDEVLNFLKSSQL